MYPILILALLLIALMMLAFFVRLGRIAAALEALRPLLLTFDAKMAPIAEVAEQLGGFDRRRMPADDPAVGLLDWEHMEKYFGPKNKDRENFFTDLMHVLGDLVQKIEEAESSRETRFRESLVNREHSKQMHNLMKAGVPHKDAWNATFGQLPREDAP